MPSGTPERGTGDSFGYGHGVLRTACRDGRPAPNHVFNDSVGATRSTSVMYFGHRC